MIRARDLDPARESQWRQLAERALQPNPLFEPDCVIPAAQYQTFGDEIEVVLAHHGSEVLGAIPVRRVSRFRRFPYPWVTTKIRRMIYCGTPLLDRERGEEAMGAIISALASRRSLTAGRVLIMQEVSHAGAVHQSIIGAVDQLGLTLHTYQTWERPFLVRGRADAREAHTSKDLRNMRRLRRRLDSEVGAEVHLVDRSDDPEAVEELIRLEAAGYKADIGVAMSTVPGEPEYFRKMCDRFRARDRFCLFTLEGGGTVCALVAFLRAGNGLFMIKVGYDQRFARNSPGLQLHLDFLARFEQGGLGDWIDVGTYAGNTTLLRMYPGREVYTSLFLPLGGPVDRSAVRAFALGRVAKQRMGRSTRAPGGTTADATGSEPEMSDSASRAAIG